MLNTTNANSLSPADLRAAKLRAFAACGLVETRHNAIAARALKAVRHG